MRIAIVGTRWGRVHVGAFRRFGHEVVTLIGSDPEQTRAIAAAEGVPRASTSVDDALDADFVVIASPPHTHADYARRLSARPILCEKPLAGAKAPRLWVNYAFGFLHTAAAWVAALPREVERYELTVGTSFGLDTALLEVAVHPFVFLGHTAGRFTPAGRSGDALRFTGPAPLLLRVCEASTPGIEYSLCAYGSHGALVLRGAYRVSTDAWAYEPVTLGGAPISGPEPSAGRDVWHEANHQLVCAVLAACERGVRAPRLVAPADAAELEAALAEAASVPG